ncbi:MAG: GspE/PulE family protein [Lachnospiraceae bacterium]
MTLMFRKKKRLGDMLIAENLITEEQLSEALKLARKQQKKIGEVLVEQGYTTDENIVQALSRQLGLEVVNLREKTVSEDMTKLVNGNILRKHVMIPFEYSPKSMNVVRVAMSDPMDMVAIDDFSIITNLQVEPVLSTPKEIQLALDKYFGNSEAEVAAQEFAKEHEQVEAQKKADEEDVNDSPIVQLVKTIIEQAARLNASDVHIEALEMTVRVRYRIDGVLHEKMNYNISLLSGIIARLKIIAGLDIAEKRKPQDGRITMFVDGTEYDIRTSILPTVYGEKCVLRLAQKKSLKRDKSKLGFRKREMEQFDHLLKNPHGIILVTGPTGSGKSTTLYTALSELNTEYVNIITVEDPVEANIDGINQVQVNTKADLTFASALRSILRQDPDIIMIGEIRDTETAEIAVQASITGHLVVSTLHTNSSASTVTRLEEMGIESYLLADSLKGIIAQRLVRCLCPRCKKARMATEQEKELLRVKKEEEIEIFEPVGCRYCNDTGYAGRSGVYEIMTVTPAVREAIAKGASAVELERLARKDGMHTLRESAAVKVRLGVTSMEEMIRVSFEN